METTVYLIKPEGMAYKEQIRKIIERKGLAIAERKTIVLPEWAIKSIYPDLPSDLLIATRAMLSSPVEMGIVIGERAVQRLFILAGMETSPATCAPGSIRFLFGAKEPIIFGKIMYYANVLHRPKNHAEADRGVELFHKL